MTRPIRIRSARPDEAETLSSLAVRSKAAWGYPAAWLELWRDALTISVSHIERLRVELAEDAGGVLGVYVLGGVPPDAELEALWVDPASMRKGVGALLLRRAMDRARAGGALRLFVDSDPNALGFYEAHGGAVIGSVPSLPEGRELPRLMFALSEEGDG